MLFDTHAHYDDNRFRKDIDTLMADMKPNGIGLIMNACSSLSDIPDIIDLCEKYPFVYGCVGVHPHEVEHLTEEDIDNLKAYSSHPKIKAIGEIGLDYYYDNSPRAVQRKWFHRQLELSQELKMPFVIHDRDAHGDTMDILRGTKLETTGVFHCYAGSVEMAKEILSMGLYIAFGGSLTFKNSVHPKEVAAYVPLDRIVLETDAPYLAPAPQRGRRNDSRYMHFVAEMIADIKGISYEEVAAVTFENGKNLFGIQE